MNEPSIDTDNYSSKDPFSITSLCYSERNGKKVPVYPYVVAFTGHIRFAKPGEFEGVHGYTEEEIKSRFKKELKELAILWKKRSGGCAPLILLTGLADGTDQIVAQAALELKDLNVKVIAVLPMNCSAFERTIKNRQKYNDILNQVEAVYELPLANEVLGHEEELNNICDETEDYRRIQYRLQAEFLSLHSHIHFVFWDGVNIDSKGGGTAETVMYKLEGNTQLNSSNILTFSSIGPVVHFLLLRDNKANKSEPLSNTLNWDEIPVFYWTRDRLRQLGKSQPDRSVMVESNRLHTSVAQNEEVAKVIKNIGILNTDGRNLSEDDSPENEKRKEKTWDWLFGIGSTPDEQVPETAQKIRDKINRHIDPGTNIFIDHYVIADMLASEYQAKTNKTITAYSRAAFWFLLFSGLISLVRGFADIGGSTTLYTVCSYLTIVPYEIALIVALTIFIVSAKWKRFHYKYHYYRAIAEALRIQIFWRIALLSGCVSGFYRSHQIYKTEWIRAAINSLDVLIPSPQNEDVDSCRNRIELVKEMWIEEQQRFFATRIHQKRETTFIDTLTHPYVMLAITVATLFFAPFFGFCQQIAFNWAGSSIIKLIVVSVLYGAIIFATAMYVSYTLNAQKSIKTAEANRYEREIFPFDRAALLLTKELTSNPEEEIIIKQDILRQLGEEALAGNSDWLLSVDKRSLELRNIKLDKE